MEPLTMAAILGGAKLVEAGFDWYGNTEKRDAERKARDIQTKGIEDVLAQGEQAYGAYSAGYEPTASTYLGDLARWRDQLSQEPVTMEFDQSGYSVDKYLDPQMAYEQQQAQNALNAQGAVTGSLFSGAQAKALQDRSQQIARQGYGDAFNRMTQDRGFGYTQFADKFRNAREAAQLKAQNLAQMLQSSGGARQAQMDSALQLAQMKMQGTQMKSGVNANDAMAQGNYLANQTGAIGRGLGGAAGAAVNYSMGGFNPIPQAQITPQQAMQQQAQAMGQAGDMARYQAFNTSGK